MVAAKSCAAYRHVGHLVALIATLVVGHVCGQGIEVSDGSFNGPYYVEGGYDTGVCVCGETRGNDCAEVRATRAETVVGKMRMMWVKER